MEHTVVDSSLTSSFVVTDAAAVLVDPGEGPLHTPDPGPHVEPDAARDAFDDVKPKGENLVRPANQPTGVASVGPYQPDREKNASRRRASNRTRHRGPGSMRR